MWNRWDFAVLDEIVDLNLTFRGSLGETVHGAFNLKAYMQRVREAFPDFHNQIDDLIAEGNQVVTRLTYTGTHHGTLRGFVPTGKRITYVGVAIFKILNGRIVECWVLGDVHDLDSQLADKPNR
jgi:steroid delta-isomerase-like uncharacterized protein